jgi:translation initiation factor IF-2
MLAAASDAIIIGFNVRPLADARRAAEREGVDVRTYSVIYKITEDLRNAMEGMLEAIEVEETLGEAEVKQTFKASKVGRIAGCIVNEGKVTPGPRRHRDLGRQARLPAPLQRQRAGSRGGPGVRHRPRRLR